MSQTPSHTPSQKEGSESAESGAGRPEGAGGERPKGPPPGVGGRPGGMVGGGGRPQVQPPDLREKGAPIGDEPQTSDTRLFMQLLAFTGCSDSSAIAGAMQAAGLEGAVYEDLNDPRGVAVLTFSTDPNHFIDKVRPVVSGGPFASLTPRPQYTMFGRSYSIGYEPDLQETLINRPRGNVLTKDWPWVVWYPLRRSGQFEQLDREKQMGILREHGVIGMSYGAGDFAHDIRLACHGLDSNDNDFVIGLLGKDLFPLSALVQRMRKTQQTSLYLERLGPFFVGRVVWQSEK